MHDNHILSLLLIDSLVQNGMTALMWASSFSHCEVVKLLLCDPRVDVNVQNKVRRGRR